MCAMHCIWSVRPGPPRMYMFSSSNYTYNQERTLFDRIATLERDPSNCASWRDAFIYIDEVRMSFHPGIT